MLTHLFDIFAELMVKKYTRRKTAGQQILYVLQERMTWIELLRHLFEWNMVAASRVVLAMAH